MKSINFPVELFSRSRTVLWAVVSVITLFIFSVIFYGERDYRRDFTINKGNSYIEGLKIVNRKDGVESWIITAKRADFSKDETTAQMASVTIDMKKEQAVLNADSGTYNLNTRDLHLENNITIHQKTSVISTETLSWDPAKGMLSSDGKVRMQGDKFRIEGEGLTATEDNKVKLMRNVKATFF